MAMGMRTPASMVMAVIRDTSTSKRTTTAGTSGRPWTSPAVMTRDTTALRVRARRGAPSPARARAAGRSRRSPADGPAEGTGMEGSLHRFVRLLRLFGVRVSVAEAADAMLAAAQPGMLVDRQTLRAALRVTLIKDRRDDELFDELFTAFFSLRSVASPASEHGHNHAHDDLTDTGELESVVVSEEPSELPQQGHSHGKPADIRDYFRQEDLAQQYNLHQEANKIDLASVTDEIVLSKEGVDSARDAGASVQLETDRLHNPGLPGQLAPATGHRVDTALTVAQQEVLLGWLEAADQDIDGQALAMLRRQLAGVIAELPELLRRYLDKLAGAVVEARVAERARIESVDERERAELEEALRRLAR